MQIERWILKRANRPLTKIEVITRMTLFLTSQLAE